MAKCRHRLDDIVKFFEGNAVYENMKINFVVFKLKYKTYIKLQTVIVSSLLALSPVAYFLGRDSADWMIGNAWWLCLVIAMLEVGEAMVAVTLAKKKYNAGAA
jgi:hypothetical protein